MLFLSPPWGGPGYSKIETFTLDLLKPKDGYKLFQAAQNITPNIIMFLPRNVDVNAVEELSWLSSPPLNHDVCMLLVLQSPRTSDIYNLSPPNSSLICFPDLCRFRFSRTTSASFSRESRFILGLLQRFTNVRGKKEKKIEQYQLKIL